MSALDGQSVQSGTHRGTTLHKDLSAIDGGGKPPHTPPRRLPALNTFVEDDQLLIKCATVFSQHQSTATPIAPRVSKSRMDPLVQEQRKVLKVELGSPVELSFDVSNNFASSLYQHLANNAQIDEFLRLTDVYKNDRWILPEPCPQKGLKESDLYEPLLRILNAIIQYFGGSDGYIREVIDTSQTNFSHKEPVSTSNLSRPDFSVKAEGPSFQLPLPASKEVKEVGYSNIITFFEVKLSKGWSPMEQLLQMAIYARQMFIQQPNRRFVRALIITERSFRIYHFDRSGVQFTQPIDIHGAKGARTFVRLVMGLSLHEADAGLDTSIQWRVVDGKKVSGTLTTIGPADKKGKDEGTTVTYELASVEPVIPCYDVRGRGVVCWSIVDPDSGKTLLVRDLWRSADRLSEDIYLGRAQRLPGTVTIISYDSAREKTKNFRGFRNSSSYASFRNRIAARAVLDTDGRSIKNFRSAIELLCALRDAIQAHKELYMKKTLHRDITLDNILLGRPGAEIGQRGLLMGLDMAIFLKRDVSSTCKDWKTTTGIYQSVIVLMNGKLRNPIAHDHMDDLESFVYVLTHMMYTYDATGVERTPFEFLGEWELANSWMEAQSKSSYLGRLLIEVESGVQELWPQSCTRLLLELKSYIYGISQEKRCLANQEPQVRKSALKGLVRKANQHYKYILALFDKAIEEIESGNDGLEPPAEPDLAESSSIEEMSSSPGGFAPQPDSDESPFNADSGTVDETLPVPDAAPEGTRNFLKRLREASPDDQPAAKRGPLAGVSEAVPKARAPRSRRRRKAKSRGRR